MTLQELQSHARPLFAQLIAELGRVEIQVRYNSSGDIAVLGAVKDKSLLERLETFISDALAVEFGTAWSTDPSDNVDMDETHHGIAVVQLSEGRVRFDDTVSRRVEEKQACTLTVVPPLWRTIGSAKPGDDLAGRIVDMMRTDVFGNELLAVDHSVRWDPIMRGRALYTSTEGIIDTESDGHSALSIGGKRQLLIEELSKELAVRVWGEPPMDRGYRILYSYQVEEKEEATRILVQMTGFMYTHDVRADFSILL